MTFPPKPRPAGRKSGRVPLERALSKLGIASRTRARAWILEGRVSVSGKICTDPQRMVTPETTAITIDGEQKKKAAPLLILLHKTKGVVTTRADEKGRPTVYSLLKGLEDLHLIPVGRLDYATTGLLLMTNDTKLAAWLTDPANEIPRTYIATVRGELTEDKARRLEKGILENGEELKAARIEILKASGRETHIKVELTEGKNREIRRMLKALGHEVTRLKRIAFGEFELGDLPPGQWKDISDRRSECRRAERCGDALKR